MNTNGTGIIFPDGSRQVSAGLGDAADSRIPAPIDGEYLVGSGTGYALQSATELANVLNITSGSGLLPTNYIFTFNGATVLAWLDFWDRGQAEITLGDGEAVPDNTTLTSGDTIEIRNTRAGQSSIWEYTGADFVFGSDTQIGNVDDYTLLYTFFTNTEHLTTANLEDWPIAGEGAINAVGNRIFDDVTGSVFLGALLQGSRIELELSGDFTTAVGDTDFISANTDIAGGFSSGVPSWIARVSRSEYNSTSDRTIIEGQLREDFTVGSNTITSLDFWIANTTVLAGVVRRARTQDQRDNLFAGVFNINITINDPGVVYEQQDGSLTLLSVGGSADANLATRGDAATIAGSAVSPVATRVTELENTTDRYVDHNVEVVGTDPDDDTQNITYISNSLTQPQYTIGNLKELGTADGDNWAENDRGYIIGYNAHSSIDVIANFRVNDTVAGDLGITVTEIVRYNTAASFDTNTIWAIYPGVAGEGSGGSRINISNIPTDQNGVHYIAGVENGTAFWDAVDLDQLQNRIDVTVSRDDVNTSDITTDATVVLDISLEQNPFDLRYSTSPTFTVDPSRWQVYDGEFIKFTYYAIEDEEGNTLAAPTIIPGAYFVGQVVGFFRNNTGDSIAIDDGSNNTGLNLGTDSLPSQHMRLDIVSLAVSDQLRILIDGVPDGSGGFLRQPATQINRWFISPANSLDALNIERSDESAPVIDYTWLGSTTGDIGHLGFSAASDQFILQRDPQTFRQDWITVEETLNGVNFGLRYDVSSNIPLTTQEIYSETAGREVDNLSTDYEITYTLVEDIASGATSAIINNVEVPITAERLSFSLEGLRLIRSTNGELFPHTRGTHTVVVNLEDALSDDASNSADLPFSGADAAARRVTIQNLLRQQARAVYGDDPNNLRMTINRFQIEPTPQRRFQAHYISGTGAVRANNYLDGGSYDSSTGTLTLTVRDQSSVEIDGFANNANDITNFNEAVINIVERTAAPDYTYTVNLPPADDGRNSFLAAFDAGNALVLDGDGNAITGTPTLSYGDTVRITDNEGTTSTDDDIVTFYLYEGDGVTFASNEGHGNAADLVLRTAADIPNIAGGDTHPALTRVETGTGNAVTDVTLNVDDQILTVTRGEITGGGLTGLIGTTTNVGLTIDGTADTQEVTATNFNYSRTTAQLEDLGIEHTVFTPVDGQVNISLTDATGILFIAGTTNPQGRVNSILHRGVNDQSDTTSTNGFLGLTADEQQTVIDNGGALVTISEADQQDIILFWTTTDGSNWTANNGLWPSSRIFGDDVTFTVQYLDINPGIFNQVGRVPFLGTQQALQDIINSFSGTTAAADTRYLNGNSNTNFRVTGTYEDSSSVTSYVKAMALYSDSFGPYLDVEFAEAYSNNNGLPSNEYNPVDNIDLSMTFVEKIATDDLIRTGVSSGELSIAGETAFVKGTLANEETYDGNTIRELPPITAHNDAVQVNLITGQTNDGQIQIEPHSARIPAIDNLNQRVSIIEGGGGTGGSHTHTEPAWGWFACPFNIDRADTNNPVASLAFSQADVSWTSQQNVFNNNIGGDTPVSPEAAVHIRTLYGSRNNTLRNFGPVDFGIRKGQNFITGNSNDAGRGMYTALERMYRAMDAPRDFPGGAVGYEGNLNDNDRNTVSWHDRENVYTDLIVSIGPEQMNFGLRRVAPYSRTAQTLTQQGQFYGQTSATRYEIINGSWPFSDVTVSQPFFRVAWLIEGQADRDANPRVSRGLLGRNRYRSNATERTIMNGFGVRNGNPLLDQSTDSGNIIRYYAPTEEIDEILGRGAEYEQTVNAPAGIQNPGRAGLLIATNVRSPGYFDYEFDLGFVPVDTDGTTPISLNGTNVPIPHQTSNNYQLSSTVGTGTIREHTAGTRRATVRFTSQGRGILPAFYFTVTYAIPEADRTGFYGSDSADANSALSVLYTPTFFPNIGEGTGTAPNVDQFNIDNGQIRVVLNNTGISPNTPMELARRGRLHPSGTFSNFVYMEFTLPPETFSRREQTVASISPSPEWINSGPKNGTNIQVTELYDAGTDGTGADLATLLNDRVTTVWPSPIDDSWLSAEALANTQLSDAEVLTALNNNDEVTDVIDSDLLATNGAPDTLNQVLTYNGTDVVWDALTAAPPTVVQFGSTLTSIPAGAVAERTSTGDLYINVGTTAENVSNANIGTNANMVPITNILTDVANSESYSITLGDDGSTAASRTLVDDSLTYNVGATGVGEIRLTEGSTRLTQITPGRVGGGESNGTNPWHISSGDGTVQLPLQAPASSTRILQVDQNGDVSLTTSGGSAELTNPNFIRTNAVPVFNGTTYQASGITSITTEDLAEGATVLTVNITDDDPLTVESPSSLDIRVNGNGELLLTTWSSNPQFDGTTFTQGNTYIIRFDLDTPGLLLNTGDFLIGVAGAYNAGTRSIPFTNVRIPDIDPSTGALIGRTYLASEAGPELATYVNATFFDPPGLGTSNKAFNVGPTVAERSLPFISDGQGGITPTAVPTTINLNGQVAIEGVSGDLNIEGSVTAASFTGDGLNITNVGDRFVGRNTDTNGAITLSPAGNFFVNDFSNEITDTVSFTIGQGLSWLPGQEIQFTLDWEVLNPTRARRTFILGGVQNYNPETGELIIERIGTFWSSRGDTVDSGGAINPTVTTVAPPGIQGLQGEQGDPGTGVSAQVTSRQVSGVNQYTVTFNNEGTAPDPDPFVLSDGERGVQGPFTFSIYQVRGDGVLPTAPDNDDPRSYDTFTGRVTGTGISDGTQPSLNDGMWHNVRPDTINTNVYVTQTQVRQLPSGQYGTTPWSGVFQAVDQGPPGDIGPQGIQGPRAITGFNVVGDTNQQNFTDLGPFSTFNLIVPIDTDPDNPLHDFVQGQFVSIFTIGSTRLILSAVFREDTTSAGVRTLTFDVFENIQNDIASLDGVRIYVNNSGPRGAEGPTGITNITDERTAQASGVTIEPVVDGDGLTLHGATLSLTSDNGITVGSTPTLSDSVVPLEMVIDWVLYTSTPPGDGITNGVVDLGMVTFQGFPNIPAIQYSLNRRLPGTWTQYIGLAYDPDGTPTWSLDPAASTFVSTDTGAIITV